MFDTVYIFNKKVKCQEMHMLVLIDFILHFRFVLSHRAAAWLIFSVGNNILCKRSMINGRSN